MSGTREGPGQHIVGKKVDVRKISQKSQFLVPPVLIEGPCDIRMSVMRGLAALSAARVMLVHTNRTQG